MTEQDVKVRVEHIVDLSKDYESAHGAEDTLFFDLLRAIADGSCVNPQKCCKFAIQSRQITFKRVYA